MIDLFSDTHTLPSEGMRRAIAEAAVGDEQLGEDPSTLALEQRVADLLGHETALFMPTGSMCNKVAVATFTRPGDAVICDNMAHVLRFESGGPAALSGIVFETIATDLGWFDPEQMAPLMNPGSVYQPRTSLVALEQTHNFAGGTVWPIEVYEAVADAAHEAGSHVYTDGARLFNAVAASGVPADRWGCAVDAVWIDLSKALGCPGGAVLAGSAAVIERATRFKYLFGGAMRQSGILAAAGLYALDHNVGRLAADHANAMRLAEGLSTLGIAVEESQTNMVFFDPTPAGIPVDRFVAALGDLGVRVGPAAGRIRAVTHLGIAPDDISAAIDAAAEVITTAR